VARALIVAVLLVACGPTKAKDPSIVVEPSTALLFGRVIVGSSAHGSVTVRNIGDAPLVVSGVTLGAAGTPWSVPAPPAQAIAAGDSIDLDVVYAPTPGAPTEDVLSIASNDPRTPVLALPVRAAFAGPHLRAEPPLVDFSLIEGRAGPVDARIVNDGTEDVTVMTTTLVGDAEFTLDASQFTPGVVLHPGDSYAIKVSYVGGTGAGTARVEATPASGAPARLELAAPPTAIVGSDIDIQPLMTTMLDGSASRAPGNTITGWQWTIVSAPAGSVTATAFTAGDAQIVQGMQHCPAAQNDVPTPCFFPDVPGIYQFALTIRDDRPICPLHSAGESCAQAADCCGFTCGGGGTCSTPGAADGVCATAPATGCTIASTNSAIQTVRAIPDQAIFVTLSWDGDGDLDLHMVRDSGPMRAWTHAPDDVYWNDPQPDWGVTDPTNSTMCMTSADCTTSPFFTCERPTAALGECYDTTDDPRLLLDNTVAFGPEEIGMKLPETDTYHLGVLYFPDARMTPRRATIHVYVLGNEIFPPGFSAASPVSAILTRNQFWYVGRVVVPAAIGSTTFEAEPFSAQNPWSNAEPGNYPTIP
jgi:hypothetical protein